MSRRKTVRGIVSDLLGSLPLPQVILAYPQDWANGPSHTFHIDRKRCPFSGLHIENLLTANGIRVWGKMIVLGDIMVTVRRAQARWAQYLLQREGIPIRPGTEFCANPGPQFPSPDDAWESLLHGVQALLDSWGL